MCMRCRRSTPEPGVRGWGMHLKKKSGGGRAAPLRRGVGGRAPVPLGALRAERARALLPGNPARADRRAVPRAAGRARAGLCHGRARAPRRAGEPPARPPGRARRAPRRDRARRAAGARGAARGRGAAARRRLPVLARRAAACARAAARVARGAAAVKAHCALRLCLRAALENKTHVHGGDVRSLYVYAYNHHHWLFFCITRWVENGLRIQRAAVAQRSTHGRPVDADCFYDHPRINSVVIALGTLSSFIARLRLAERWDAAQGSAVSLAQTGAAFAGVSRLSTCRTSETGGVYFRVRAVHASC